MTSPLDAVGRLDVAVDKTHAQTAAAWWADRLQLPEHREAFQLAQLFEAKRPYVGVDYDPDETILEALRASGICCSGSMFSADDLFPRKIGMVLEPEALEVSEGRRALYVPIWFPPGKTLADWHDAKADRDEASAKVARTGRYADQEEAAMYESRASDHRAKAAADRAQRVNPR